MVYFRNEPISRENIKKIFLQEKRKILKILFDVDVQHIGSTAIPNSLTKGDLDIQIRVKQKDFTKVVEKLNKVYKKDKGNRPTKTYAGFKKNDCKIPVGIQVTVIGSKEDDFAQIRDVLLFNPEYQREYNSLKNKFNGKSMKEYRRAKEKFFNQLKQTSEFKKFITRK